MNEKDGGDEAGGGRGNLPPYGWTRAAAAGLSFRPMTDADLPFLAQVYASTRMEELSVVAWPLEQKLAFLKHQFDAQHAHYRKHYHGTDWLGILHAGAPARPEEHTSQLPAHRYTYYA